MNPQEFLERALAEQLLAGSVPDQMVAQNLPVGQDPIFPMGQEEFSDYVRGRLEQKKGVGNPTPKEILDRIPAIRARLGLV